LGKKTPSWGAAAVAQRYSDETRKLILSKNIPGSLSSLARSTLKNKPKQFFGKNILKIITPVPVKNPILPFNGFKVYFFKQVSTQRKKGFQI
jgi:hypothetical protein